MLKNVIAPMQAWLMSQGRCVGCSQPLVKGKKTKHAKGYKITCNCGRVYIQNDKTKRYRRALIKEV